MRTVLLHCKEYMVKVGRLANRPEGIVPEEVTEKEQRVENCILVLVTAEKGDEMATATTGLVKDIMKFCKEVNTQRVVVLPFAHLSNNLLDFETAICGMKMIEEQLADKCEVTRAHFGSSKELLMHLYDHPGNARYREYYPLTSILRQGSVDRATKVRS